MAAAAPQGVDMPASRVGCITKLLSYGKQADKKTIFIIPALQAVQKELSQMLFPHSYLEKRSPLSLLTILKINTPNNLIGYSIRLLPTKSKQLQL